ncbi:MAG: mercury resistance system periplasmic binding protein MerP [Ramlibacter sp.]
MIKPLSLLLAGLVIALSSFAAAASTATLDITNMMCAACPITVRKALEQVPGVETAKVDFKAKSAVVAFDPAKTTAQALTRATADAGFPSTVKRVQ